MSKNTLLILPETIKDRTQLHTNVDNKLIYPEIKAMQDMYMLPLLGSKLFEKLQDEIEAKTLTGDYATLRNDYLLDCLCWLTIAEMTSTINYQIWNTGVATTNADKTSTPDYATINALRSKYKGRADHYIKRARMYLMQNSSLFTEYTNIQGGIDTVYPEKTSYTSPIYLGDESDYPHYSYSAKEKAQNNLQPFPNINYNP